MKSSYLSVVFSLVCVLFPSPATKAADLDVLFLGDNGHHQPKSRFAELQPVLKGRGIQLTYTDQLSDLTEIKLKQYDALLLYANIDEISPSQAEALLKYVSGGGGFVPLHCATYCFRNSPQVVALMGAQFQRHGTGVFRAQVARPNHELMRGYRGFESWDETYVHHLHNDENRTVLEYRVDGQGREPWTWVRTHGAGRVFYTAWGHDSRTWTNPGFQNLVERGIRWAAGGDPQDAGPFPDQDPFPVPEMKPLPSDLKPFEYADVGKQIPNYTPSEEWGTQGEPLNMMQKPVPPEESIKHLVVPEGFHVELFASEPELGGKPICMSWDQRGRLWVAETYDYPNELQPPGKGRDRIRICEDTDNDGKADKFTVFAEGLSIPTSIAFSRGGLIVQNGTQTLYLKDTDGDDKADQRKVLVSNWSLGDTHGGVSNFQYGLDNWIWAMQGYNNSKPAIGGESQQGFRMGFFRMRPDGSEIEFIRSTDNNTWGLGISEEGLVFGSTANGNPSTFMPIPNRYYERVRGWAPSLTLKTIADTNEFNPITDKIRQVDHHGGYTAAAGHALYTARQFPREYWNRVAFVNGPTGHLVGAFVLSRDGSGFRSTSPFNLLASDDEWTAPIMSEVGPDGCVWVIDWYNYIVQHNPTPEGFETGKGRAYETTLRDKKRGRIYRVVYDGDTGTRQTSTQRKQVSSDDLATGHGLVRDPGVPQLIRGLAHPTMLIRKHAQRLLVERGQPDVVPALLELVADQTVDEIGLNVGAIHALWTLHGLGALDGANPSATSAVVSALKHPSAGVRRNAVQVLPDTTESVDALLASGILGDANLQVRLTAMLALADLPATDAAGAAVLAVLNRPDNADDPWIPDAATSAAAHNSHSFLRAVTTVKTSSDQVALIAGLVANHYARGKEVADVDALLASLIQADPRIADAVVDGLNQGWRKGVAVRLTPQFEEDLESLLERLSPNTKGLLVRLATSWGSQRFEKYASLITESLLRNLRDPSKPDVVRVTSARQLVELQSQSDEAVRMLLDEVSLRTPPGVASGIVAALELSRASTAGEELVSRLRTMTPMVRSSAMAVLLKRPELTHALLAGAGDGSLSLGELALDQKQALANHPNRGIREAARKLLEQGGSLPNADRQKVLEELLSVTQVQGDPANGKLVFVKHCAKCHTHGGAGAKVGPDLTGMAVHPKKELLTHIIDPSRNVEGNYRVYTVVTLDGLVLSGMLASESKTSLELFDAEGKRLSILRDDVDELIASPLSIMPEGFEKQITPNELSDLLEFLTQRGRFLPVAIDKVATTVTTSGMLTGNDSPQERLVFDDWRVKMVEGVPFVLVDPRGESVNNAIMLHGPQGRLAPKMPKSVRLSCDTAAVAIHILGGVAGWAAESPGNNGVSMIVRLHYADGATEDHPLIDGRHIADYRGLFDVPESKRAFDLDGRQLRYLQVRPKRMDVIQAMELVKPAHPTAPIVMAITVEKSNK